MDTCWIEGTNKNGTDELCLRPHLTGASVRRLLGLAHQLDLFTLVVYIEMKIQMLDMKGLFFSMRL